MVQIEKRLSDMGLELPDAPAPVANYIPAYRAGNLVFLSGVGPRDYDGNTLKGKVGKDVSVEDAYQASRMCALNLLANLRGLIGDLDKVKHIVKLLGMVNGESDFTDQPAVINGCSELLVELFEEKGRHARSAVGMGSLPGGMAVEIEMIVEVED